MNRPRAESYTSNVTTLRTLPCSACEASRHKCDNQEPACFRCTSKGIQCKRKSRIRFRHTLNPSLRTKRASGSSKRDLQFSPNQTWLRITKSFNFVDETREVINIYETNSQGTSSDIEGECDGTAPARTASPSEGPDGHSHTASLTAPNLHKPTDFENGDLGQVEWMLNFCFPNRQDPLASSKATDLIPIQTPPSIDESYGDGDVAIHSSSPKYDGNIGFQALLSAGHLLDYGSVSPNSPDKSVQTQDEAQWHAEPYATIRTWPLKDRQEAQLFYYWVRNLAPLFDLCDHERHFATVIPQHATTCSPLLNAILAASAKHSSRMGLIDPVVADKYYQASLTTIIPLLFSNAVAEDENLLAAIVILRFVEEVDGPFSPADPQSHLIGTRALLAARDRSRKLSKLWAAVFWVALRQEIFMALTHSRSVHPDLLIEDIVSIGGLPECDCDYANRVVFQAALCVQYCFGEKEQQILTWEGLNRSLDAWYAARPWQFYSMSSEEDENQFLPEPRFLSDAGVTGSQHYYLARLVLEAHNPKTPKLGPARKMHLKKIDEEMKRLVRTICGIAKANPHSAPAHVAASVSIVISGDRFTEKHEQDILYDILVKTGEELFWPTWSAQEEMRLVWGWPVSE
ncbi:hypothetical protein GGR51DRAFT_540777 [Nemania sp. FL0031]|nr:hypothetical protein GGR51DRAFT_540777 [Nemania sp. FL0031]